MALENETLANCPSTVGKKKERGGSIFVSNHTREGSLLPGALTTSQQDSEIFVKSHNLHNNYTRWSKYRFQIASYFLSSPQIKCFVHGPKLFYMISLFMYSFNKYQLLCVFYFSKQSIHKADTIFLSINVLKEKKNMILKVSDISKQ